MNEILKLPLQFFAEGEAEGESAAAEEQTDDWGDAFAADAIGEPVEVENEQAPDALGEGEQPVEPEAASAEQTVTITHLGQTQEIPLSEAVSLAQKGMDYDHVRQERDELRQAPAWEVMDYFAARSGQTREEYIQTLREQMEQDQLAQYTAQGMDEQTAKTLLELKQFKERQEEENRKKEEEEKKKKEYHRFFESYPDVNPADIPDEVWQRVGQGESLLGAYQAHENQQLKAKLAALEQNEKNKQAAVGSLAGEAGQDEVDPFLQGFLN